MRDPFELVGGDYLVKHLPLRSRNRNRIVLGGVAAFADRVASEGDQQC